MKKTLAIIKILKRHICLCQGDYIAISDQDDIWELNKIESMMKEWPGDSSIYLFPIRQFYRQ